MSAQRQTRTLSILLLSGVIIARGIQRKWRILASIAAEPIELKAERTTRKKGFTPQSTLCHFGNSTNGADCTVQIDEGVTRLLFCLDTSITCQVHHPEGGSP